MIWQYLWSKVELIGMLFLFLLLFSKAWQLALGKMISLGIGKIPELIGSIVKALSPITLAILKGLWTVIKWIFWFLVESIMYIFKALSELFKLLLDRQGS